MPWLLTRIGSLGNAGAVANAHRALEERQRQDWVVDALARRLPEARSPLSAPKTATEQPRVA
ncbi:hypothetical protein BH24ACT3_BH24ACT3_16530 [soil metagenome]